MVSKYYNFHMTNLTIIDGHNWLFRAFYGVPDVAQTKSGIQVNAVYGFFAFLRQIASTYPDNKIFVVFDSETGTSDKLNERDDYKAGRVFNTDMFQQLPYIKQILDLMNVKWLEHPRFEADDIIASLATHWTNNGCAYISSNDFDFTQLVSDKIHLIRTSQGKLINCNDAFIQNKFGICPNQYVDYLSLTGDKTDNIQGCCGIGSKTAAKLLNDYKNIDGVFNEINTFASSLKTKLLNDMDLVQNNRRFIAMNRCIPIDEIIANNLYYPDHEKIQQKIAVHLTNIGLC